MDYLSVLRLTLVWCCIMCKCSILTIWNMHVDGTSGRHTLICWCSLKRDDTLKWICRTQEDYVKAVHLFPDFTAQVTSAVLSLQRQTMRPWQQRRPHGLREQDNLPKCSVWRRLKCCCISGFSHFQKFCTFLFAMVVSEGFLKGALKSCNSGCSSSCHVFIARIKTAPFFASLTHYLTACAMS